MPKRTRRRRNPLLHKIMTALGVLLCAVFGFMLVCNLTLIIKGTVFPDMPPSVLGITPMVTLSGSMSGTQEGHIEVGDLIIVNKTDPASLEVGDVITFKQGSIVVTHRIQEVQTAEDGSIEWITKGDANNAPDQMPVNESQLVGVYALRIPKVGDLALFMQQPLGMAIFIGIPILGFIIYDIIRRQLAANRENEKAAELQAELNRLRAMADENKK